MTAPMDRLAAALSDCYRLERELGAGGMATVYLAEDLKHKRRVAIKVLRPELAAVIGAERFLVEIQTTANLQHPHILALHDSGEVNGTVFYVMPFIDGESLRDRLQREKQLPVAEAVETFLAEAQDVDPMGWGVPSWVERDFRSYLRCGILAHGFARVRCTDCGHDRLLAFSCKGRGVCPSCNARRMAEVAAHLTDEVIPHLPPRAVGALRAQTASALPAPDARGGECGARHLPAGAPVHAS